MKKITTIMATCGLALMAVSSVQARQITCQITGQRDDFIAWNCRGGLNCYNDIFSTWIMNDNDTKYIKPKKNFNTPYDLVTLIKDGNCKYQDVGQFYNWGESYTYEQFKKDYQHNVIYAFNSQGPWSWKNITDGKKHPSWQPAFKQLKMYKEGDPFKGVA